MQLQKKAVESLWSKQLAILLSRWHESFFFVSTMSMVQTVADLELVKWGFNLKAKCEHWSFQRGSLHKITPNRWKRSAMFDFQTQFRSQNQVPYADRALSHAERFLSRAAENAALMRHSSDFCGNRKKLFFSFSKSIQLRTEFQWGNRRN